MSAAQNIQQHPIFVQAQTKLNHYNAQFDKELSKYPVFVTLEQRTQVPKTYSALGALALLILLHTINSVASPVSNLVGWALPAYLSFKAIESPSPNDDVQWLTYWVVFGFFNFLESFALGLLLHYFSWYYAVKTIFIIWLQLPAFRGAQTTYVTVLKPLLSNFLASAPRSTPATTTEQAHAHTE